MLNHSIKFKLKKTKQNKNAKHRLTENELIMTENGISSWPYPAVFSSKKGCGYVENDK